MHRQQNMLVAQINERSFEKENLVIGVPQGCILGPSVFNLHVVGLQDRLPSRCLQYIDETTLSSLQLAKLYV